MRRRARRLIAENVCDLAMLPVMLAQGVYTLWNTPRLPEPAGARHGRVGGGPELRVLVAGDSSAAGVGASSQDEALAGRLVRRLAERFSVSWRLVAKSGLTTVGVIELLEHRHPEPFDVALVAAGVNDVTRRVSAVQWMQDLDRLVELLSKRFGVRRVFFSQLPPMHEFPALPGPLRGYLGRRARELNRCLREFALAREECSLLGPPPVKTAGLMAADGFHPGPPIYAAWADSAAAAIHGQCSHSQSNIDAGNAP